MTVAGKGPGEKPKEHQESSDDRVPTTTVSPQHPRPTTRGKAFPSERIEFAAQHEIALTAVANSELPCNRIRPANNVRDLSSRDEE